MTDKEKVRAEIERLYNQSLAEENRQAKLGLKSAACASYGKSKVCKELLSFIDSMQKEPVSEDFEEAIEQSFIYHENRGDDFRCDEQIETSYRYGFEAGANWQLNQIRKENEKNRD